MIDVTFMYCVHNDMFFLFFFNDTATTEIYTLSLHDALPILQVSHSQLYTLVTSESNPKWLVCCRLYHVSLQLLRSEEHTSELQSPVPISYAVFCLKKKKNKKEYYNNLSQSSQPITSKLPYYPSTSILNIPP